MVFQFLIVLRNIIAVLLTTYWINPFEWRHKLNKPSKFNMKKQVLQLKNIAKYDVISQPTLAPKIIEPKRWLKFSGCAAYKLILSTKDVKQ